MNKGQAMAKDWRGNGHSVYVTLGASNHTDKEREAHDFYATDSRALDLLSEAFELGDRVWECACGIGSLSSWLEESGRSVLSTDLIDRGYGIGGVDFLNLSGSDLAMLERWSEGKPFDIVTNPPYSHAVPFVLRALELVPDGGRVAMFLKTTFLEGKERRHKIYDVNPPRWVFQFSERVLCAKNGEFDRMRAAGGSACAYAWFVWEKENRENITEVGWI